jgi:NAD+ kinase
MSSLTLGIYAHWRKPGAADSLKALVAALRNEGIRCLLEQGPARLLREEGHALDELFRQVDLFVALGGDGTLLRLIRDLNGRTKPVMGINFGSLGFLTCFGGPDFVSVAQALAAAHYRVDERTLLEARLEHEGEILHGQLGLNDVVVSRGERSRLVQLEVWTDQTCLAEYNADGLIVATATGSTAYSLSAGGPIVTPNSGVFVVTPICPHVLTNRSVIVSNRSTITLRPSKDELPLLLSVDGQDAIQISTGDSVIVRAAEARLPLLLPKELTFADILRAKLRWSGSAI